MKIAIVSSSCPPLGGGGISSAHFNLYKTLKERGVAVKVFTYADHASQVLHEDDVVRAGTPKLLLMLLTLFVELYNRVMINRLAFQLPDILESMAGCLKINKSVRSFRPDILILPDHGAPGFFIRKIKGCKVVLISHHNAMRFLGEPLLGRFSERDVIVANWFEKKTLKKVDKVVCPSVYMRKVFTSTHAFNGPVEVVPNLVDYKFISAVPRADVRVKLGLPSDAPLIYIPAGGTVLKGSRFVFEIIRRLASKTSQIGFFISGTIYDELLKRELFFVPPNVKIYMPGHLSYSDNIAVVKSCSFCISPTLIESFGMALLEANACSLPVIAFDVGGNADVIVNKKNGVLVPFMDIETLVESAEQLLRHPELLRGMRLTSEAHVLRNFGASEITKRYLDFFSE